MAGKTQTIQHDNLLLEPGIDESTYDVAAAAGIGLQPIDQVVAFGVEYSISEDFPTNSTVRVDGQVSFFLSDRGSDRDVVEGVYEVDITGLQVTPHSIPVIKVDAFGMCLPASPNASSHGCGARTCRNHGLGFHKSRYRRYKVFMRLQLIFDTEPTTRQSLTR